jgi:hypothetical protein
MELTSVTLQIFLAIVLVIVLGVIGVLMYNWENVAAIRRSMVTRKEVPIFLGVKDLKNSKDETYITASDRTNPNFRDVDVAVNQPGGAEFTYNFWLYVANDVDFHRFGWCRRNRKSIKPESTHRHGLWGIKKLSQGTALPNGNTVIRSTAIRRKHARIAATLRGLGSTPTL